MISERFDPATPPPPRSLVFRREGKGVRESERGGGRKRVRKDPFLEILEKRTRKEIERRRYI